jgi:hypothetical protein
VRSRRIEEPSTQPPRATASTDSHLRVEVHVKLRDQLRPSALLTLLIPPIVALAAGLVLNSCYSCWIQAGFTINSTLLYLA